MEVLQRDPESCGPHPGRGLDPVSAVTGQPLSCPNHEGKVGRPAGALGLQGGCRDWGGAAGAGEGLRGAQGGWEPEGGQGLGGGHCGQP